MSLGLIVMGTSPFCVPALRTLASGPHRIIAVYTQPPRPAGRGHRVHCTVVHEVAEALGLPVLTPPTLKDAGVQQKFREHAADLAVVAAYGLLLPRPILDAPRLGCINLHASLLPRWRGAAPIQRAILAGDRETGVCIFQMEPGLDTGPVYAHAACEIGPRETAASLHDRLAALAAGMLPATIEGIASGALPAVPQATEGVTYASKTGRDEGRLDFARPADELDRQIRALGASPGCWCEANGERLAVLAAEPVAHAFPTRGAVPGEIVALPLTVACGGGALSLLRVQRPGRKPLTAAELQRGFPLPLGTRLS